MIIKELLTLPPWVNYEGIHFQFEIFLNGSKQARLCYSITHVDDDSLHKKYYDKTGHWLNRLADPENLPSQSWLYLQEGIESDADLIWSIRQCWYWLQERGLLVAINERR